MPQEYNTSAAVVRGKRKEEFNAFMKTITPLDLRRYNHERTVKGRTRIHNKFPEHSNRGGPFIKYISR